MDIFDFALKLEKDGEDLYTKIARESENQGLKSIFKILAADEQKHYHIFEKMKNNQQGEMPESKATDEAKVIFSNIKEKRKKSRKGISLKKRPTRKRGRLKRKASIFIKKNCRRSMIPTKKKWWNASPAKKSDTTT